MIFTSKIPSSHVAQSTILLPEGENDLLNTITSVLSSSSPILISTTSRRQMDRWGGRYVQLRTADVPIGWSNHPVLLRVETYFADGHRVNECLHPSLHFSHPWPILTDTHSTYIFEEKGRGYFLWNDVSGSVAQIMENSWEAIITKLRQSGLVSMTLLPLRTLDGPSGEPTSNIPYPPNPDFVDRPRLTKKFQVPPHRSVFFFGPAGCG